MERTFDEILKNIEKELSELRAMNQALIEENEMLRQNSNLTFTNSATDIPIEFVWQSFDIGYHKRAKASAFLACKKNGIKTISDLKRKTTDELLKTVGVGIASVALLCVVCHHYRVDLQPPTKLKYYPDFNIYLKGFESVITWV